MGENYNYSSSSALRIPARSDWGVSYSVLGTNSEDGLVIRTLSGRTITAFMSPDHISFRDFEKECFLTASVNDNGVASFSLRTRHYGLRPYRHPDFRAKYFIPFALSFFEMNVGVVTACDGLWDKGSDNFKQFEKAYRQAEGNRVQAAISTWSGQQFTKNGFNRITHGDIIFVQNDGEDAGIWRKTVQIQATFRK